MRTFIFFLLLSCMAQAQSYTEKYNELYNRFDYTNSQGKLIGYKYYDTLYKVWKYKDLSEEPQSSYIDPINQTAVRNALNSKDRAYKSNVRKVDDEIQGLYESLKVVSESALRDKISLRYNNEIIKVVNNTNINFSRSSDVQRLINFINAKAAQIIEEEYSRN